MKEMTPETEQATRFPARRLAIMAGLVLAVVATPLMAGFLLFREGGGEDDPQQAGTAVTEEPQGTMGVICDIYTFHSLERLVSDFPGRADVVLARIQGDPEVRLTEMNGGGPVDPNDYDRAIERISVGATVLEYFLGEGPSAMRVDQTSAHIRKSPDGTTQRALTSGCGYVELTQGKTYVLFLRHFAGHPQGDDLWGPIGVPSAFEVDGQDVVATDDASVTPADFGWATLADVRRDAEAVKATLAAGQ